MLTSKYYTEKKKPNLQKTENIGQKYIDYWVCVSHKIQIKKNMLNAMTEQIKRGYWWKNKMNDKSHTAATPQNR